MEFKELNIVHSILKALEKENYKHPTPIQEQAIPPILAGKDLLGCAQTGTGKTAAFAIPTLQLLSEQKRAQPASQKRKIQALILSPTRELALQIFESFNTYGKFTGLRSCVVFGGVSQVRQVEKLRRGVDILVATPGRLNDLINQGHISLQQVKIFVLDEADRMLDMGFIVDIKKVIQKLPKQKQTLLFSATMPAEIADMADSLMENPVKVSIAPEAPAVDTVTQKVYCVDKANKRKLLQHILQEHGNDSVLVFTRTKHGANRVALELVNNNISAQAIHSNKSQNARQQALKSFKNHSTRVLVATDIAARGIDIDELPLVINFDLPETPETYVHRIGRTGRAGQSGTALSFQDFSEKPLLKSIEKLIGRQIEQVEDHPFPLMNTTLPPKNKPHRYQPAKGGSSRKPGRSKPANGKRPARRRKSGA